MKNRDVKLDLVITPAYQSYFSAGDESEILCPTCNCNLDEWNVESKQFKYCPECGQHIKTLDEMELEWYKITERKVVFSLEDLFNENK